MSGNWSCKFHRSISDVYDCYECIGIGPAIFFSSVRWDMSCPGVNATRSMGCEGFHDGCGVSGGDDSSFAQTWGAALAFSFDLPDFQTSLPKNVDTKGLPNQSPFFPPVPASVVQVPMGFSQVRLQRNNFTGSVSYQHSTTTQFYRQQSVGQTLTVDAANYGMVLLQILPNTDTSVVVGTERDVRETVYLAVLVLLACLELVYHLVSQWRRQKKRWRVPQRLTVCWTFPKICPKKNLHRHRNLRTDWIRHQTRTSRKNQC